jgi:hypothetical protein
VTEEDKTAVEALISLFYQQEELARVEEVKTDAILDGKKDTEVPEAETSAPKTHEEFIEETVAKCRYLFFSIFESDVQFLVVNVKLILLWLKVLNKIVYHKQSPSTP